jgi:hypothetical protein
VEQKQLGDHSHNLDPYFVSHLHIVVNVLFNPFADDSSTIHISQQSSYWHPQHECIVTTSGKLITQHLLQGIYNRERERNNMVQWLITKKGIAKPSFATVVSGMLFCETMGAG